MKTSHLEQPPSDGAQRQKRQQDGHRLQHAQPRARLALYRTAKPLTSRLTAALVATGRPSNNGEFRLQGETTCREGIWQWPSLRAHAVVDSERCRAQTKSRLICSNALQVGHGRLDAAIRKGERPQADDHLRARPDRCRSQIEKGEPFDLAILGPAAIDDARQDRASSPPARASTWRAPAWESRSARVRAKPDVASDRSVQARAAGREIDRLQRSGPDRAPI